MGDADKVADEPYDDSEWTRDEMFALAWEAGKSIGWDEMEEYDELSNPANNGQL